MKSEEQENRRWLKDLSYWDRGRLARPRGMPHSHNLTRCDHAYWTGSGATDISSRTVGSYHRVCAYRYGLLATVSTFFFAHLGVFYAMTTELSAWYATDFTIALVICLTLAGYGFYISLGGRSLFSGGLLEG